jgi:hypothetical protein
MNTTLRYSLEITLDGKKYLICDDYATQAEVEAFAAGFFVSTGFHAVPLVDYQPTIVTFDVKEDETRIRVNEEAYA